MSEKTEALRARKGGAPIVCLTAYSAPMARIFDRHADLLLVGDSVAMVLYGMATTVGISIEAMIMHGKAVRNSSTSAAVIVDMPAGSYEISPEQALTSARRIMDEVGCDGVKLEGGVEMAPTIKRITDAGIPVMAHIGLTPQSVEKLGGYRVQGKTDKDGKRMMADAHAVEAAGAFGVVIECSMEPVANQITRAISIPTIGIGASTNCDGQILVSEDMLGITAGKLPRFVKHYADIGTLIDAAAGQYAQEVRDRKFPASEHLYHPREK